ncbi:uncharacterized protein WCC33_009006 [Rhinophrynus dorsalis]
MNLDSETWSVPVIPLLIITFIVCLLLLDFMRRRKKLRNFPPGPPSMPFVGNMLQLDFSNLHINFKQLAKQYGDIFSLQFFWQNVVVLNGFEVMKEALLQKSEDIADRPRFPLYECLGYSGNSKAVVMAHYGRAWKEQRRFSLSTLRDFGMGKKSLEQRVTEEAGYLCSAFQSEEGHAFNPHVTMNIAVSNIICSIIFGDRFEYDDHRFQKLLKLFEESLKVESGFLAQVVSAVPWLTYVPGLTQKLFEPQLQTIEYLKEFVVEHQRTWDAGYTRDLIDAFLLEMEKAKGDKESSFNEKNLLFTPADLFTGGTETTTTTLRWALLFMLLYPDVQRKVHEEIDQVIGRVRKPTMGDVSQMPYTNAVIHEIQRCGDIFPLAPPHMTYRDTEIHGYFIPKGMLVMFNLSSVLKDERVWEKPFQFYPEHFLDADGKFVKREAFLAFSAGRRACLGEQLARMELFLFFTSLLQSFTLEIPSDQPSPSDDAVLAVTLTPKPYEIYRYFVDKSDMRSELWSFLPWNSPNVLLLGTAFILCLLLLDFVMRRKKWPRFPPGPQSIPFLGNMLQVDFINPHTTMTKLSKTFGDVYSLQYFWKNIVVLNGFEVMKEALLNKSEDIADRPRFPIYERLGHIGDSKGLLIVRYGKAWKEQRRFSLSTLRNFGMGKKSLEERVTEEAQHLCSTFQSEKGRSFDPRFIINNAVSNVICSIVFGDRFDYDDVKFQKLLHLFEKTLKAESGVLAQIINEVPWLMKMPYLVDRVLASEWEIIQFLKEKVSEHQKTWDPDYIRDFIDAFLLEMEKVKGDNDSSFNETNLLLTTYDLFSAGTETTSTTLRWAFLFMILYPDIQSKVHEEIDRVIGRERKPTMGDILEMPYTNAVIHEVQRCGDIVPLALPHMSYRDTEIQGYFIPKGTTIITNLSSVLKDERVWEKPLQFYPEHFLDEGGKFVKREAFMAFSAGRRACLGEKLARMELFLFFTALMQRFMFEIPSDQPRPREDPLYAFTLSPYPYEMCAVVRGDLGKK